MNTYFKNVIYFWLLSLSKLFFLQVILSIARTFFFFLTKAISTGDVKSSTHPVRVVKLFSTFNFQISVKKKEEGISIYYKIMWNLRNLIQMIKHFSSKYVFRWGLYVDYIFTFSIGNNCITRSPIFQMASLEKCILEIALAAINDMEGDNLSKRNEWVMRRFNLVLIKFW